MTHPDPAGLWDLKAPLYRPLRSLWPLSLVLDREIRNLEALLRSVPAANKRLVLDLGCGSGDGVRLAGAPVDGYVGLDRSRPMLVQAQKNGCRLLVQADAGRPPFKPGSFPLVMAVGLSEYQPDLAGLMAAAAALMQSGGYVLFTSSPDNLPTLLRRLQGTPLTGRSPDEIIEAAHREGLEHLGSRRSLMQNQFLFRKRAGYG